MPRFYIRILIDAGEGPVWAHFIDARDMWEAVEFLLKAQRRGYTSAEVCRYQERVVN